MHIIPAGSSEFRNPVIEAGSFVSTKAGYRPRRLIKVLAWADRPLIRPIKPRAVGSVVDENGNTVIPIEDRQAENMPPLLIPDQLHDRIPGAGIHAGRFATIAVPIVKSDCGWPCGSTQTCERVHRVSHC